MLAHPPSVNYISSLKKKKKTIKTSISHYVAFTNTLVNSIDIEPLLKMKFCGKKRKKRKGKRRLYPSMSIQFSPQPNLLTFKSFLKKLVLQSTNI